VVWTWKNWNATSLLKSWTRADLSPLKGKSDGCSTALIVLALERAGIPHDDMHLSRGLVWLAKNQTKDGSWPAYSINGHRDPATPTGVFMNDAATAYAALALLANGN
jgi:hypothetical protein